MQDLYPVLFLVGIGLVFWLLLVRPQVRRQRELAHLQSTLEVGDEVMLTSGVFATIRSLEDAVAEVEIADGVTIRVARGAIGQLVPEQETDPVDDEEVSEEN